MADTSPARGRWVVCHVPPAPRSIVELIRAGTLDAELAATLWVLIEQRVPVLVAGAGPGIGKTTLLDALRPFLPERLRVVELRGADETFDWLPQAGELGWDRGSEDARRHDDTSTRPDPPVRPDTTVIAIPELSDHLPSYTWGEEARIAIRAAAVGYGLLATIHGDTLEDVFASLARPPVALAEDELSRLGIVLVLRRLDDGRRRVAAAHYVRPTARDEHGHVQRLGPAVLTTWDPATDRFEHFGWGITPELAVRVGRRPGDYEREHERRKAFLDDLAAAGIDRLDDVRRALAGYATAPVLAPS